MKCSRCTDPDYCACHDFFESYRAFHRGEYDPVKPSRGEQEDEDDERAKVGGAAGAR